MKVRTPGMTVQGKWLLCALWALLPLESFACDPCALYNATQSTGLQSGSVRLSISEQYTSFDESDKLQQSSIRDGDVVKSYSNTQLSLSYDISSSLGLQATLPLILRRYDQYEQFRRSREEEFGLGDGTVIGYVEPISDRSGSFSTVLSLFGGVKLPTGDTGSISSSIQADELQTSQRMTAKHHPVGEAVGGRVLTLGTGSVDFPVGVAGMVRYDRAFILTSVQYTLRTEGAYDYEFADDTVWEGGLGAYLLLEDSHSLSLRIVGTGKHKASDRHQGMLVPDSALNNYYLGPRVVLTALSRWVVEGGADLALDTDQEKSTVVPDVRVRGAVSYRF